MRIRTLVRINSVSTFRKDWYDTPAGPRQQFCACTPEVRCLYHWYYEVKGGERPKEDYKHGAVEQPRTPRKRPAKRGDAAVRVSGGGTGDRPKSARKKPAAKR